MRLLVAVLVLFSVAALAEFNAHFWERTTRSAPSDVHSVVFAVSMIADAATKCDSMLMERATVGSPKFGQHMSFDEVGTFFRNKAAEQKAVRWLRSNGILPAEMRMTPHGEFIRVKTTVAKLERVLKGAKFHKYAAKEDSKRFVHRALDYVLPNSVREFITMVSDTNVLPVPQRVARHAVRTFNTIQSGNVSPSLLNSYYNITTNTVKNAKASLAVFESLGQDFSPNDLSSFQQQFNLPASTVTYIIGPNDGSQCAGNPNACGEANLDVQWALAVAQGANFTYWSVPGDGDIFLQWIEAVAATPNPPLIHSVSYGSLAPEDPKIDVQTFNTNLCKLGLKGLTVVIASGDDGVANYVARSDPTQCGFTPSFPATSPYGLSVGATQGPEAGGPEIACTSFTNGLITSGGGFSAYVSRPTWQNDVVNNYLAGGPSLPTSPPRTMFSSLGRAYPDVAMIGHNFPVFLGGQAYIESGTSASAPVVAAMLTLVNSHRLNRGKSSIGYITPTIYKLGGQGDSMFFDITSGTNNCCAGQNGTQVCCQYGFTAIAGWDPVTGFGSVNFARLLQYFGSL